MVPKIRFKSFAAPLGKHKIEDILARFVSPVSVSKIEKYREIGIRSHGKGLFHKDEVSGAELGNKRVFWIKEDAIIFNIVFAWEQAVALTSSKEEGCIASHRFPMYLPKDNKCNTDYIRRYFLTKKGKYLLELASPGGAGRNKTLGQKNFDELVVTIPDVTEQTKIADFLSSVDEKIALLKKQYDLLCQYKKGMMQKIFSQEVRFKDENGEEFPEWNSCQLKDVATRVTRKNKENNQTILTISGRDGLVDQMSYFNKQIASKNVTGYYLINNGEFAYNKSYSQGYPMGAIKMLTNYDKGVVSTLYICFKLNENQYNNFYQHYFESGLQNRSIEKVAQEGARNHGLLNIGVNDFFDIELQIPSLKEQIKIADFLSALDDKITTKKAELDTLKTWTQGLLQQMFV